MDGKKILIDEEFQHLLPMLDEETYELLTANLLEHGCRDALVLWKGHNILIDGHNRFSICNANSIPFKTVEKHFDSREEVLLWIINNQFSRRNMTPIQLSHFRGVSYRATKQIVSNLAGRNQHRGDVMEVDVQNDHQPQDEPTSTAGRLSKKFKVSQMTIRRDAKIADAIDAIGEVSSEAKKMILQGEVAISKKELQEVAALPKGEVKKIAQAIVEGTWEGGVLADVKTEERPASSGSASVPAETTERPLLRELRMLTDGFYDQLQQYKIAADQTRLKAALQAYINDLQELHGQI